jgi:hypothetical protein
MNKNLLFTKLNVSLLMGNAPFTQSGYKRSSSCLLGIEAFVNG